MDLTKYTDEVVGAARRAAPALAASAGAARNAALQAMASGLEESAEAILEANRRDVEAAKSAGLASAMIDRLTLDGAAIAKMAKGVSEVAALADPLGRVLAGWTRPNGLRISKVSVPIGVVLIIYESRPNVTADAAGLCIKSGNAAILRGGSESINSNLAIGEVTARALTSAGLDAAAVQLVSTTDREAVGLLLKRDDAIDLVVPRGGYGLIRRVAEESQIPVVKHYSGVCHVYVDSAADLELAAEITVNAKVQRPGVCNAAETLLVHADVAERFLPTVAEKLAAEGVELRGCPRTRKIIITEEAADEDWTAEYLDLILAVRVVDDLDAAIEHINTYGSRHSDAIVTGDLGAADRFVDLVDASCVFVNTTTRFSDGFEFGFGAEIGISTDKIHARGPMGLDELTSYKYVVRGTGQLRT
jgi:glutamate-5-semialdehyde dehydrogenase